MSFPIDDPCPHDFGFSVFAAKWPVNDLTYSFMPDGTVIGVQRNTLFTGLSHLNYTSYNLWQDEFRRALACWASVTPLTFREVPDNGSPANTIGQVINDPRFGDIRFGGFNSTSVSWFGYTYAPSQSATRGGDVTLNTTFRYMIGSYPDLFTVVLHETGHSLGLNHSLIKGAAMYPYIGNPIAGLTDDDIAGIQSIYGKKV